MLDHEQDANEAQPAENPSNTGAAQASADSQQADSPGRRSSRKRTTSRKSAQAKSDVAETTGEADTAREGGNASGGASRGGDNSSDDASGSRRPAQAPAQSVTFQAPSVLFQPPSIDTAPPAADDLADEPGPSRRKRDRSAKASDAGDGDSSDTREDADSGATSTGDSGRGTGSGADDSEEDGGRRRRRRRGGRRRNKGASDDDSGTDGDDSSDDDRSDEGRTPGEDDAEADQAADLDDDSQTDDTDGSDTEDSGGGSRRRRRRRRRKGESIEAAPDDPETTIVKVREPRKSDEVTSVEGSTRLEAKRQRRREGREAGRRRPPILSESEFLARRESVERTMVIRQHGDRTQIGVLEDDVLVEHYVTRETQSSMIGNVYLGRVQNVLPSMEAAFVDIGRGRNAVLYAGEVDWTGLGLEGQPKRIETALKSGQTVLVQVTKDPVGHKGARLTSQISIPGRYLVYVPHGSMNGISRKLPDTERTRLKQLLKEIVPEEAGVVVRTAAEGASEEELSRDVARLQAQWQEIEKKAATGQAPNLLYAEPDLLIKVVRDLFTEDFTRLVVSGDDAWDMVDGYVRHVAPHLGSRLERWTTPKDVFASFRIDEQIMKALDRKVWLPSGGSLIIERTEAMTVIDVNTGKFTGAGGNLEETVTKNNLEAAEEIVRQLRLRDIGGIIVVDFIDMVLESNRDLVLRRLVECLGRDRTKHQVAEVTSLGLVQMTRKRIGTGLLESFSETCEACNGRGVHIRIDPVDADDHSADGENGGRRSRRRRRGGGGGAATVDGREADRTSAEPEAQPDTTGTSAAEPVADAAEAQSAVDARPAADAQPAVDAQPAADAQPAVNAPAVEAQPAEATVVPDVAPTADAVPNAEAPAHTGDHAQLAAEAEPQPAAGARADETEAQPAASTEDSAPESDEATAEESDEARAAASDAAKAPEPDAAKAEEPVEVGADPSAGVVVEIRSSAQVDHDAAEVVPAPAPSADPTAEPHDAQSQADQSQADQREADQGEADQGEGDQGEGDQGEGDEGPHEAEETVLASATAPVDPTVEALNGEAVPAAPETANPDEPTPANLDEPTVPTQHLDQGGAPEQGDASQRGEGDGGEHGGEAVDRPDDQDETPEGDDTVRSEQTTQDGEQETEPETRQNQGSTAGPTSWW